MRRLEGRIRRAGMWAKRRPSPSSPTNKSPSSPQSASLGRTAALPSGAEPSSSGSVIGAGSVPRRNSLGDLKIPARISQAQVGLRRDLGMVREFAANIERKPFPLAFLSPSSFASRLPHLYETLIAIFPQNSKSCNKHTIPLCLRCNPFSICTRNFTLPAPLLRR